MPEPIPPTPPAQKIEELLAEKHGILSPTDSASKAGAKMRSLNVDVLPVSEGRRLVGVMDQPNPDRTAAGHGHDPNTTPIAEAMNREAIYCFEDQDVAEVERIMAESGVETLPVVDRELRIVGMIRRSDLASPPKP